MEGKMKCSSEEHKDINAIIFCPECKIYMCNKCEKHHSPLFKNHQPYKLKKDEEIFTGFCQEPNHPNKLEFYCKDHNQLCCATCLCKISEKGYGTHKVWHGVHDRWFPFYQKRPCDLPRRCSEAVH